VGRRQRLVCPAQTTAKEGPVQTAGCGGLKGRRPAANRKSKDHHPCGLNAPTGGLSATKVDGRSSVPRRPALGGSEFEKPFPWEQGANPMTEFRLRFTCSRVHKFAGASQWDGPWVLVRREFFAFPGQGRGHDGSTTGPSTRRGAKRLRRGGVVRIQDRLCEPPHGFLGQREMKMDENGFKGSRRTHVEPWNSEARTCSAAGII